MKNWGCEFLDLGSNQEYKKSSVEIYNLPLELVYRTAHKNYLIEIESRDKKKLQKLTVDISRHGILTPLVLLIGPNGVNLFDGNHRLIVGQRLNIDYLPCKIKLTDSPIKNYVAKPMEVIPILLEEKWKKS